MKPEMFLRSTAKLTGENNSNQEPWSGVVELLLPPVLCGLNKFVVIRGKWSVMIAILFQLD